MSAPAPLRAALARDQLIAALREADKLVVVTHEHPDGDALGSLIATQLILTQLGKDSVLYIVDGEFPLPYEYGFLGLPGHISAPPTDLAERTLVFLDCGNIDRNPAAAALCIPGAKILNVDHHHDNTRFGTVNHVDAEASCTAEIVWGLMGALGAELTPQIAEALYVGLLTDSGSFNYDSTSPRSHLMAAELIAAGIEVHRIYRRVYEDVPYAKLALLARGLSRVERYDDGRLIVSQLSAEDFAGAAAESSYSEGVIDHLRAVRDTVMAALVRDRLDPTGAAELTSDGARVRKVSLRASDDRVDVSAIARELGGGGHRAAAGFTTSLAWEPLVAFLRAALERQLGA
ncbi:bifunctional oligoribonuclease/PAP phosphatase NrnA [Conexibacter sp. DBS9H8]|uniref:DHH family phosphoesterase n=1 Tax=Conexibacter sp. DBS9H8 TaxID=2937801 RepID=UPI00200D2A84|nr:DHH family phosphoesterase [Conexibacter sp. DBS9H8]